MTVSVLVPFRDGGCPDRARAWEYVRNHYESHHGDWDLVVGTTEGDWSKGAAIADALSRANGDVLVLADADSFVSRDELRHAVEVLADAHWVIPHGHVLRLRREATEAVYRGFPPHRGRLVRRTYQGTPGGGIVVLRRESYEAVGIDPRFYGWGGEDMSFGWALHTLVGPYTRLDAQLWHLWHPHPAPKRRGSPESEALAAQYRKARDNPERMEALCAASLAAAGHHPQPDHL